MIRAIERRRFAPHSVTLFGWSLAVAGCVSTVRPPDILPTQVAGLNEATSTVNLVHYRLDRHIAPARAIVEVTVSEMLPQMLATGSEVLPTPFAPQPNEIDELVHGTHNQIYQPMILSVDEVLVGSVDERTSIVVAAYIGLAKGAMFAVEPHRHIDIDEIAVGTKAIVFVSPAGLVSNRIMEEVRADAFEREGLGMPTYAGELHHLYRFEGTEAINDTGNVRLPIDELREYVLNNTPW